MYSLLTISVFVSFFLFGSVFNSAHSQSYRSFEYTVNLFLTKQFDIRYVYLSKFVEEYAYLKNKRSKRSKSLSQKDYQRLALSENLQSVIILNAFTRVSTKYNRSFIDILKLLQDHSHPLMRIVAFSPGYGFADWRYSDESYAYLLIHESDNQLLEVIKDTYGELLEELSTREVSSLARELFIQMLNNKKVKSEYISNPEVIVAINELIEKNVNVYGKDKLCKLEGTYARHIEDAVKSDFYQGNVFQKRDAAESFDTIEYRNVGRWMKCKNYSQIKTVITNTILKNKSER